MLNSIVVETIIYWNFLYHLLGKKIHFRMDVFDYQIAFQVLSIYMYVVLHFWKCTSTRIYCKKAHRDFCTKSFQGKIFIIFHTVTRKNLILVFFRIYWRHNLYTFLIGKKTQKILHTELFLQRVGRDKVTSVYVQSI